MRWASNTTGDIGEVQPNFDPAEMGAFRTNGSGDAGPKMAGWADEFG